MKRTPAFALVAVAGALALGLPPANAVLTEEAPVQERDDDFAAGKRAVEARRWDDAVASLRKALVRHPDNADLHNYLGYSYRHLKQLDLAFEHYKRAIALDPRHRGAHEYIGEAYLMVGDLASAEKHLEALKAICLLPCEEHADLKKGIARYRAGAGSARESSR